MEKIFITKSVDERNAFITELYNKGISYSYGKADSEGNYKVKYEEKE